MLARAGENVYWAARYLERAEDTARLVREHTNLMVDLPTTVPMTWAPLDIVTGASVAEADNDELAIIRRLVAATDNSSSVLSAIRQARENLRTTRELIPQELWQTVNDVYLYAAANALDGVARPSRRRFLDRVVNECQLAAGVVEGTMQREAPYHLWRIGTALERADMTTRIVDVAAIVVGAQDPDAKHVGLQWAAVLRSLSALQTFRRAVRAGATGPGVISFALNDARFPRSVAACLQQLDRDLAALAAPSAVNAALADATRAVEGVPAEGGPRKWRAGIETVQTALAELHQRVTVAFFAPPTSAAAVSR